MIADPVIPIPRTLPREYLDLLAFNEKMAELGRISVGVVHEINTPLSVIVSASQLVMLEDDLPDSVRELVERIRDEAQRLSQMTKGLLSFSRQQDDPTGETDINQTMHDVIVLLKYEIQKRSVRVVEQYDDRIPLLPFSGNRLKQVFINLTMNALQAMDGRGVLSLITSLGEDGSIELRLADTGPGIPSGIISRIFDPFFTTKPEGEGTGLGLYVSRSLVEAQGGSMAVKSAPGAGTEFFITFPPFIP